MLPQLTRLPAALIALALGLLVPVAHASSICRWTDGSGRTHLSDVVPDEYRQSATCSDSRKYAFSPEQKREAQDRAASQQGERSPESADWSGPAVSSPRAAPPPRVKRPTEAITDATDCQTHWRIYDESMECFGPYRTARGATRAEGFGQCNDIPSPEIKCGPRRN